MSIFVGRDRSQERVTDEELAAPMTPSIARDLLPEHLRGQERYGYALKGLQFLRKLFDEARNRYESKVRGGKPICRYEDACCEHRTPEALDLEAQDLQERWHLLPDEDRITMEAQLAAWVHRQPTEAPLLGLPSHQTRQQQLAVAVDEARHWGCSFYLRAERRCGIEAWRPIVCRAYGMFNQPLATCDAPLAGSETAERRHLYAPLLATAEDTVRRVRHMTAGFIGFLVSIAAKDEGYRPHIGAFLPWLLWQKLRGRESAVAELEAGLIHPAVASYLAEPPYLRWAKRDAIEAGVTTTPEDAELLRTGQGPRWKRPIIGMPTSVVLKN